MPRKQGVYQITNTLTGDAYIGSSVDIARRWADHRRELKNNCHKNSTLQAAYDRDGVKAFLLGVLEHVEYAEQLVHWEQHYLDLLIPSYNGDLKAIRAPYRTWRSDEADRKRFWSKVDQAEEGCWLWQGTLFTQGYGCFKVAGKMCKAHRIAYTYATGPIPPGLVVCHSCDNPQCVRPTHLFVGTHKDNTADMMAKGRGYLTRPESKVRKVPPERHWCHLHPERQRGQYNHHAKLTQEQVEEIRTRYASRNVSQFLLAAEFGVAQTTISAIVRRLNWND